MENFHRDLSDKEGSEQRASNTEWLPTKCRITKPPPPKPATNPLQFIKVAPCPLFQKAQEHIKKVEEIKVMRQEIKDEPEDWQQNLDNWKSSRRKRQEHIIERVVEVKKLEQEEQQRGRRKSKTFSEILEDRDKRGHRVAIPIYDDDFNDLSDYGIGSSSSKTNSIKDVDTDDSSSILDEKEHASSDSPSNKDLLSGSNQSQSEEELVSITNVDRENNLINSKAPTNNLYKTCSNINILPVNKSSEYISKCTLSSTNEVKQESPQYTYEGAIEDYRSRIRSTINIDESVFNKDNVKSREEEQKKVPKVDVIKRKGIFEFDKPIEINHFESSTSRRLSEDFANSQSIKDRLKSLEKCTEQSITSVGKGNPPTNCTKSKVKPLDKEKETDSKNNNEEKVVENNSTRTISYYLLNSGNLTAENKSDVKNDVERYSSPEAELYMNKLNNFNTDLDNFLTKEDVQNSVEDFCSTRTSSTSFAELIGISSDREDSGIHTADVSCSVSQADEPIEDTDLLLSIPNCIEKLNQEKELIMRTSGINQLDSEKQEQIDNVDVVKINPSLNYKSLINSTQLFLIDVRHHYDMVQPIKTSSHNVNSYDPIDANNDHAFIRQSKDKAVIYENVEIRNFNAVDDIFANNAFPLTPAKRIEPPREKPPPPPPIDDDVTAFDVPNDSAMKRLNSTKRIKKEINIKRSSFLGLSESFDVELDPEIHSHPPPDINLFLKKESQMEKSLYRKLQGSRDVCLSEGESQDSGLESEKGRLSSDTWCSSYGESNLSTHGRQDSEQTYSVTSEEDEITKKEREIIELIEKEEKCRDKSDFKSSTNNKINLTASGKCRFTNNEEYNLPNFSNKSLSYQSNLDDDQDSEVLKVEHELLQLEREELERQIDNVLFRESHAKMYRQNNRRSLDNICDTTDTEAMDYRKSMPELQHSSSHRKSRPENCYYYGDVPKEELYHKSMPDIQQAYFRSVPEYQKSTSSVNIHLLMEHRKSMSELQENKILPAKPHQVLNRQPIMPGKPLKSLVKEQREKERYAMLPNKEEFMQRDRTRLGLLALSAPPKSKHIPNDNWIQAKVSVDNKSKNYNQHWLYQEAELRRLAEQQNNGSSKRNITRNKPDKHIPEPIIQTLTQRVQNRVLQNDRNQPTRRPKSIVNKDYSQQSYLNHPNTFGHASPVAYPPPTALEDSQGKMLSVSGKKKCSYCGNELGRGAAMIIESLCLCYHMECFKCCVCHVQLGDGLMGTDVRVRNQKLHCHNCYSSDDGVKFSCV